ncbi:DNA-deoxyinosine glycosylase [Chitinibacter bivalviorum]|uniref:DNA-deoxyinosine glycosylase n=1 Tax=Chitinibacter bivalviorum TaxID=2739434 RepID=A0A7H9BN96_9NEIS|nr:DNA-deoxyinosine glycosylase [Chitinibacter bivalviorum]
MATETNSARFKTSFEPVANTDCTILILGSLPGDASLVQGHYYAHPRNAFWGIMSQATCTDLNALPFEERYPILLAHQIALWDVVQSAIRPGSLDSALAHINPNALSELIFSLPNLSHIIFNGQTAAKHGSKLIPGYIKQSIAPSTSPAHTLSFDKKLQAWLQLLAHKN